MKKRYIFGFLLAGSTFMASCTKDFDSVNINPNKTTDQLINPNYFMSQAEMTFSQTGYDQLLFQSMWTQSLASTFSYYSNGDKYVLGGSGTGYYNRTWNRAYNALTLVDEMKNLIKDKPEYSNLDACGSILRVMFIQRITDLYGDAPYSQEGQAKSGVFNPVFDKQQDIYTAMLSQLETAIAALDASKAKPTADLFYAGDIPQWKKLGYSLMLRVAMRLTKVDAATAKTWAEKAYAGGTMSSIADNAKVMADANGNSNSNSDALLVPDDFREVRWGKTLIDFMKSSNDPRISAVAEITAANGRAANEDRTTAGNNTASVQLGLPNGYDLLGGATDISKAAGYPGATPAASSTDAPAPLGKYSRPRLFVYAADKASANMLYTYGESELFLAEAAARGWATGTAATHYANALAANMESLAQINATPVAVVSASDISTYVSAHPLSSTLATALEQINMEYYVATSTMFNFNETFNNWRRSGFPNLSNVVYSGQYSTTLPRRMPYPITLPQTNGANYQAAVTSMGGDTFTTRVWWDKQ